MDDKALASKLDKFTEELKNIAKILKVANGFKLSSADPEFKGGPIKGDERKRAENVAKITAKELAAALGVQFKTVANTLVTGVKGYFDTLGVKLDNLASGLDISAITSDLKDYFDEMGVKIDNLVKVLTTTSKSSAIPKGLSNIGIAKAISKTLGWPEFRDRYEEWNASMVRKLISIRDSMAKLVGITQSASDPKKKNDKKESKGIGSILGGIAGLALLGVGIFMIVQALIESNAIDPAQIIKVLLVMGAFVGLFLLIGMAGSKIKNAAIGFAIISATILFLIIPTLYVLKEMPWDVLLMSILKFGIIALVCIGIIKLLTMIPPAEVLKSVAGLALFVFVMGVMVIPLLKSVAFVEWEIIGQGLLKIVVISGVIGLILFGMSKISASDTIKSLAGVLIFTLLMGYIVIPQLKKLAQEPFEEMIESLVFIGLIMVGIGLIIRLTGEILTRGGGMVATITGLVAVLAISFLMGYLADQLNKFADLDWSKIGASLALALVALGVFGAAVAGIGLLVLNPVVAPLLVAGAVAVAGLTFLMGMLADALGKFSVVDGEQIKKVGVGLIALGTGLVAFLAGMVGGVGAGVVSKIAGIFGLNPADEIKKFEKIDADKIFKLGSGLLFMSQGLKALSKEIDLTGITNQLIAMTAPLALFSSSLVLFAEAYKKLDATIKGSEINQIYQMKLEADNGLQKALVDLNQKEVEILSAQLDQLRQNGEYLRVIASTGGNSGGGMMPMNNQNGRGSASISNFETKDSYLNHLKLTTSALQA